jgi:hypothetical protein
VQSKRDQRPYNVAYYKAHREQEIERVRRRQNASLEFLRNIRCRPCADCGQTFPAWVMDFDHRDPNEKSFAVMAGKALLKSRETLLAEVAKCDVVCANCHAIRTYKWLTSEAFTAARRKGTSARLPLMKKRWRAHAKVLADLRAVPCADCGRTFPFYVMQFDHRDPSSKRYVVTRMIGRAGLDRILEEVAKCDVVCSNCHRERTYRRRIARIE